MTAALAGAVELLERSLGYTRVALADVTPALLGAPTPCTGWTLARLLAHMEDALDAFTEAAAGHVRLDPATPSVDRVEALRDKACALLGAWAEAAEQAGADPLGAGPAATREVGVGDLPVHAPLLVAAGALEITVHGWDVAQATGRRTPIPDDLAVGLLPVAQLVVLPVDRGTRFAAPRPAPASTLPSDVLVAFLGRMTGPLGWSCAEPPSHGGIAS